MIRELRWKFIAVMSLLAMAVSLLVGGISGVRMGPMVVRALAGGLCFAILAAAVNVLAVRLFPELLEKEDSDAPEGASSDGDVDAAVAGRHVNILSPEDDETILASGAAASEGGKLNLGADGAAEAAISGSTDLDSNGKSMDNIEQFSGAFSADGGNGELPIPGDSEGGAGHGPIEGKEPEEYARAIHTVLKRDEKG